MCGLFTLSFQLRCVLFCACFTFLLLPYLFFSSPPGRNLPLFVFSCRFLNFFFSDCVNQTCLSILTCLRARSMEKRRKSARKDRVSKEGPKDDASLSQAAKMKSPRPPTQKKKNPKGNGTQSINNSTSAEGSLAANLFSPTGVWYENIKGLSEVAKKATSSNKSSSRGAHHFVIYLPLFSFQHFSSSPFTKVTGIALSVMPTITRQGNYVSSAVLFFFFSWLVSRLLLEKRHRRKKRSRKRWKS